MNPEVLRLCEAVRDAGGQAMLVGGSVRDQLLGIESKDFDVEVYSLDPAKLREILEQMGQVNTVGEHFSVYKLLPGRAAARTQGRNTGDPSMSGKPKLPERFEIDVSIPRRESKAGRGHRGFVIEGDPTMTFEAAARRRDFTINAILYDPLTAEYVDPYNGREDLNRRILKAVAADTFVEDSLRVLRAVQLAARFEMTIEPNTIALCQTIELSDLPHERIWGEVEKLLTLASRAAIGLEIAFQLGVLDKLFPELRALVADQESAGQPPERSAFNHTKLALDAAAKLVGDLSKPKRIAVMLGVLCHDLRKPPAAEVGCNQVPADSKNESPSRAATLSVLNTLGLFGMSGYDVRSHVLELVTEHLKPVEFYRCREITTDGDFRRLAQRVDIDLLYRVAKACSMANESDSSSIAEDWFIARARLLGVEHSAPAALLQGRHLIEAGFEPGPQMGQLLRRVYELQLDGEITTLEEGIAAALRLSFPPPNLFR